MSRLQYDSYPANNLSMRKTVILTISLTPVIAAELEELQRKDRRSRSEIIREALRCYAVSQAFISNLP